MFAHALDALRVNMIEQPLRAGMGSELDGLDLPVPIYADESCHARADLARLAPFYDGVNIKLGRLVSPQIRCAGPSLNASRMSEPEARAEFDFLSRVRPLPEIDPVRFGVARSGGRAANLTGAGRLPQRSNSATLQASP